MRNNKGITLITLVITIVILLILSGTVIYKLSNSPRVENISKLKIDLENIRDKVLIYYNKYGTLPLDSPVDRLNVENKIASQIYIGDNEGDFYYIDLYRLENLTLNFGEGYIINDKTLNVYYLKGIEYDGKTYFSLNDFEK